MEDTIQSIKASPTRKASLIAGAITLILSVCVIFPIESGKSSFISDLVYTFLTLALALLFLMFGLMGEYFFKGVLLVLLSAITGFLLTYFTVEFGAIVAVVIGIPSGIVTALIFMVVNFYFLKNIKNYRLIKQIGCYMVTLIIVSVLFFYGGDWIFAITEYFKQK